MLSTSHVLRQPQVLAVIATGAATAVGVALYFMGRTQLTPTQREERRRTRLAQMGRIIDGMLIQTTATDDGQFSAPPSAIIYRYRIGGVTYECGQDVSDLASHLPSLGPESILFGTPVQVRYDRNNPADSIIVAETWNGLWTQSRGSLDRHH